MIITKEITLNMNKDKKWIFIHSDTKKKSKQYSSKEEALQAFNEYGIRWKTNIEDLPNKPYKLIKKSTFKDVIEDAKKCDRIIGLTDE